MDNVMFERGIARIASGTSYPATPELRARVLAAIAATEASGSPAQRRMAATPALRFALVAALALLVTGIALALLVPPSRSAIADFFGIQGSHIEVLPTPAPGVTPTPFPTPAGIETYATPSSLDELRRDFGFAAALPPGEGAPDHVYVADYLSAQAVILQYASFDLWEVRLSGGTFNKGVPIQPVFDKLVGSGTKIEDLTINGSPAAWISGGAHIVRYVDANGRTLEASVRTVTRNTLVWHNESFFYRLETDLPEADAIRIAKSLP